MAGPSLRSAWRPLLSTAIGFALPPRCAGCGAVVGSDHRFCHQCWQSLRFLGPPWCAGCHTPFAFDRGAEARCPDCLTVPPRHAGVDAAVAYGPVARAVVLRLKYGARTAFAETAARLMVRHLSPATDLLVPVPLHRWRIWGRGYNQAALIAQALSASSGVPVRADILVRQRATPVLKGLNAKGRRRAVQGAFGVARDGRQVIAGRHVVLIDDVYTSGATSDAAVAVLRRAGAASVAVLCWARVLDGEAD